MLQEQDTNEGTDSEVAGIHTPTLSNDFHCQTRIPNLTKFTF